MEYEGYRGWRLVEGELRSLHHSSMSWDTTMMAKCDHGCNVATCLDGHECLCGLYSLRSFDDLLQRYGYLDVYGIVINHGKVLVGEDGYRSEKATIKALFTADFHLADLLRSRYPGVEILLPPPELLKAKEKMEILQKRGDSWQNTLDKRKARLLSVTNKLAEDQKKFPGGREAEQERLLKLLRGTNRGQIVEFCRMYSSSEEWLARNWLWKGENSKKAVAGDMVFEANDDTRPYVFIGSVRNAANSGSTRWLMGRNGYVFRRMNIRRWDEEPELTVSRAKAILEWE